jgi:hypothetical protein
MFFLVKEIAHLAKKAGIAHRIGTTNRLWHWFTCNVKNFSYLVRTLIYTKRS